MATHVPTTLVLVSFQHHKRVADELVQEPDLDFVGNDLELTELLLRPLSVVEMHGPEIVTVDESRSDGRRNLAVDTEGYLTARYVSFPEFP